MKLQKYPFLLVVFAALLALARPESLQAQFYYTTSNGAVTITGCSPLSNNVVIPPTINDYPVTTIANYASWSSGLTNVSIPASVTNIGPSAFNYCPTLMSFTVNGGNQYYASVGGVLFDKPMATLIQCPMAQTGSYTIPTAVTHIDDEAFLNCSHLTSVTLSTNTMNIGGFAFSGCSSLTGMVIPDSVTNVGNSAFGSCTSLKNVTIGNNVRLLNGTYGGGVFTGCSSLASVTFGTNVANIGISTFDSCSALTSVVLPNSVTNIDDRAFMYCSSLASVTLSTNVVSIGQDAFAGSILTSVSLPGSLVSIGDSAFSGLNLTSVSLPGSVTNIGDGAFDECSDLNSITVDGSNPAYASVDGVLFNKALTTLVQCPAGLAGDYVIPNSVTLIGNYAFGGCSSLTSLTIPNSVIRIGNGAIGNCYSLISLTIPNRVTSLGDYSFANCYQLRSITIPNSVTSIGFEAFYDCSDLTKVTIGNGVTSISDEAFAYCTSLHQVLFLGNSPGVNNGLGSADNTIFRGETGTAYYLPGATGWGATFGGWNTAPYSTPATDFTYLNNSGTITITDYVGSDSYVLIPPTIAGNPVTTINDHVFYNQAGLTSVTIPASVTRIGDGAFAGCPNLTSIAVDPANPNYASADGVLFDKAFTTLLQCPAGLNGGYVISNNVTSLGNEAFENCAGLTSILIGSGVTNVGNSAFSDCFNLASLTLPGRVTSLGDAAFGGCSNLTSITIPASVSNVGVGAFANCSRLTQAFFLGDAPGVDGTDGSTDNSVFAGETGTAYYTSGTANWSDTFGGWPTATFINPATEFTFTTNADSTLTITGFIGLDTDISIPASINGYPVTSIGDNAFNNQTNLTSVVMADSVTNIGAFSFYGCSSLTNVTIGNGVNSIGQNAFNGCSQLTSVTIPDSVTSLGISAFYNCSGLMNATIGNGLSSIGFWTFYNCSSLTNVTFGNRVANIDNEAFNSCSSLTSLTLPNSVTNIGDWAFSSCSSLTNVTLGNGLISIGDSAFDWCSSLTSVTLPASVSSLGAAAFGDCYSLTTIAVDPANPNYATSGGVLFNHALTTLIEYPAGLSGSYAIPDGVTNLGDGAFEDCSGLTSVTFPASLIGTGNEAFNGCWGLTNFTVNAGNSIYASAGGVLFNKTLTTLLQYPTGLTGDYEIPAGVTSIGFGAFWECDNLTSVVIPASVTSIGDNAFNNCSSLTSVTLPASVASIGDGTFEYCYDLTNVTILNGVTNIGNWAFFACFNLTSVVIPASVTNLGFEAFAYCSGLQQGFFLGNAPSINGGDGSADTSVFNGETGMVYYRPGTSGWNTTFGGWPTVLWNPQMQTADGNFGVRAKQFGFNLTGTADIPVVVEACTNLGGAWTPLFAGSVTNGSLYFSDPQWTNYPQRFYRVRSP